MARVCVIVPAYNAGKYLADTLDSVLAQTFTDWECVICNDGSTDNTAEIAGKYCALDGRFTLVSQPNAGLSAARNAAIRAGHGEFILPLDADDKIGAEYLELAVAQFDKESDTKLVYCEARLFGAVNSKWNLPEYRYERLIACNCIFCSCMYRRKDAEEAGLYDENFCKGYEDWDFLLRLLHPDDKVVRLPKVLFYYRQHSGGSMLSSTMRKEDEILPIMADKYPQIYDSYRHNVIKYMRGYVDWEDYLRCLAQYREDRRHPFRTLLRKLGIKKRS